MERDRTLVKELYEQFDFNHDQLLQLQEFQKLIEKMDPGRDQASIQKIYEEAALSAEGKGITSTACLMVM